LIGRTQLLGVGNFAINPFVSNNGFITLMIRTKQNP
jgi:hypothetical protein